VVDLIWREIDNMCMLTMHAEIATDGSEDLDGKIANGKLPSPPPEERDLGLEDRTGRPESSSMKYIMVHPGNEIHDVM
jgi:hypothetical protein